MSQPLEQFKVIHLWELPIIFDISLFFSTFMVYSLIGVTAVFFFFQWSVAFKFICSTAWQKFLEICIFFILDIIAQQIGKKGLPFFVLIFVIFNFLFIANLVGLTPYAFTTTSHVSQTFTFSLSLFLGITFFGFLVQRLGFFWLFVPGDVFLGLVPFLIIIEIISYISRAFSLAIRLFANMVSGHTLLNILSGFSLSLFNFDLYHERVFFIIPIVVIFIIFILELCISFLQAYVFAVLLCIYLNDSLSGH